MIEARKDMTYKADPVKRDRMKLRLDHAAVNKYEHGVQKYGDAWGGDHPLVELYDDLLDSYVYAKVQLDVARRGIIPPLSRGSAQQTEIIEKMTGLIKGIALCIEEVTTLWDKLNAKGTL